MERYCSTGQSPQRAVVPTEEEEEEEQEVALNMFRTVFPSIIGSLRLYIQHQVYVKEILLTACLWERDGIACKFRNN